MTQDNWTEGQDKNEIAKTQDPFSSDQLMYLAKTAEKRIAAIKQIKNTAIALTNSNDWVDQSDRPYLQVSGSEKLAGAFAISWEFRTPEPTCEEDQDGHYTYTYHGRFTMVGRSIDVDGSRSSRDGFFSEFIYKDLNGKQLEERKEKAVGERTNKRDVKMAALTNLLGNGITRMLGLRNLTYDDLEKFAGIRQDDLNKVKYKSKTGGKPDVKSPEKAADTGERLINDSQSKMIYAVLKANDSEISSFLHSYNINKIEELKFSDVQDAKKAIETGKYK